MPAGTAQVSHGDCGTRSALTNLNQDDSQSQAHAEVMSMGIFDGENSK